MRRLRHLAWCCLLAAVALCVAPRPADARQTSDDGAEAGSYSIEAAVAGERVTISITELSTPVGALELELRNVPALETEECALASGMGACAQTDDVVRIVALNPTGWQAPTVLLELEFVAAATEAELTIGRGTDVTGVDLAGTATTTVDATASSGSSTGLPGWLLPALAVAVLAVAAVAIAKARSSRPVSHPE